MATVTWHGSDNNKRSTNIHQCSDTALEVTITYEGAFDTLRSNAPNVGDLISGFTSTFVEDVDLTKTGEADKAVMTIHGSNRPTINVDENEWLQTQLDIRFHPNFDNTGSPAGMWALTQADRDAVDAWEAQTEKADKTAAYNALSSNAQQLALRIQRGQTNYAKYIPVCRRTSYYLTDPSIGTGVGTVQTPTPIHATGYQYILTADRAVKRGYLWERVQEWTGFKTVDTSIVNNS